jgi:hypothetical protein
MLVNAGFCEHGNEPSGSIKGGEFLYYILSNQGLLILSDSAHECVLHIKALEGSRGGKGEAACTVMYNHTGYVTSQQGRVSIVCNWQSLATWDIAE